MLLKKIEHVRMKSTEKQYSFKEAGNSFNTFLL